MSLGSTLIAGFNTGYSAVADRQKQQADALKAKRDKLDELYKIGTDGIGQIKSAAVSPELAQTSQQAIQEQAMALANLLNIRRQQGVISEQDFNMYITGLKAAMKAPTGYEVEQAKIASEAQSAGAKETATLNARRDAGMAGTSRSGTAVMPDGRQIGATFNTTTREVFSMETGERIMPSRFIPQEQTGTSGEDVGLSKGMGTFAKEQIDVESNIGKVITLGETLLDSLQTADTPTGFIGALGRTINTAVEQVNQASSLLSGQSISGVKTEQGDLKSAEEGRFDFGRLSEIAANSAELRSNLLTFAYVLARANEPGARQLSDADIQNQLNILGGGNSKAQMDRAIRTALGNAFEGYREYVNASNAASKRFGGLPGLEVRKDLEQRVNAISGGKAKAKPLETQPAIKGEEIPPMPGAVKDNQGRWVIQQNGQWYEIR